MNTLPLLGFPASLRRRARLDGSIAAAELAEAHGFEGGPISARATGSPVDLEIAVFAVPGGEIDRPRYPDFLFREDQLEEDEGTVEGLPYRRVRGTPASLWPDANRLFERGDAPVFVLVLDATVSRAAYAHELADLSRKGVHVISATREDVRSLRRGARRGSGSTNRRAR